MHTDSSSNDRSNSDDTRRLDKPLAWLTEKKIE